MQKPEQVPAAVKSAIERFNGFHPEAKVSVEELQWYPMYGCYGFVRHGMFHGVELDGHIHT